MSTTLFNNQEEIDATKLFEQYKLYVELTDRVGQRRATANSFFITANAALLTVASWFQKDFGTYLYLLAVVGILLSLFWFFSILSYKQLSAGRFKVICEIEKRLPLSMFAYEWNILKEGKDVTVYWPLSKIERIIPFIFVALYIILSIVVKVEV